MVTSRRFRYQDLRGLRRSLSSDFPVSRCAFDVLGGEWLAVMPFDALAQREGQLGAFLAPRPADGEVGHDRLHSVLWGVLFVHHEIIEDAHHWPVGSGRRFLVQ